MTTVVLPKRRGAPLTASAAVAVAGVTTVVPTGADTEEFPVRRATWSTGRGAWSTPAAVAEALRAARRDLSVFSAVLVAIGVVFGAAGLPAALVVHSVVDEDRFVRTFAGLSADRDVRDLVERSTVDAVEQYLPVPLDAEAEADASVRRATRAVLHGATWEPMWERMVRSAHGETLAALRSDPVALARAGRDGGIGIRISPAVAAVRERLIAAGVPSAGVVPPVDRTVVLVNASALDTARTVWRWLAVLGSALPWLAVVAIGLGVAFSRHRWRTLAVAAFAFLVAVTVADGVVIAVRNHLVATAPTKEVADAVGVVVGTASLLLGRLVLLAAGISGLVGVVSLVVLGLRARHYRKTQP